jgi:hypothetical protein
MLRGGSVWIAPGSSNACIDRNQLAEKSARDHLDDRAVVGKRMRCGYDLGSEARLPKRCGQHGAGFAMVHRHARFTEHVLSCLERCDGQRRMHIGPCADADGVDAFVFQKRLPVFMNFGKGKLVGDPLAGFPRPVCDSDDLYAVLLFESRNVECFGVAAGSDQANADPFLGHDTSRFSVRGRWAE